MKNGNINGTLILNVERGNEINIEYSKRNIINKINSYFGYNLIKEIKLQTFSLINNSKKEENTLKKSLKKFENKIREIKNNNLKNSLLELLETIKK